MRNTPLKAFAGDNKKKKKYTTKENLEHMRFLRSVAGNKPTKDDNIEEIYSQIRGDKSV
jgi:hypothetical protein